MSVVEMEQAEMCQRTIGAMTAAFPGALQVPPQDQQESAQDSQDQQQDQEKRDREQQAREAH